MHLSAFLAEREKNLSDRILNVWRKYCNAYNVNVFEGFVYDLQEVDIRLFSKDWKVSIWKM